jgi:hypothetical protein
MSHLVIGLIILVIVALVVNHKYQIPLHIPATFIAIYFILKNNDENVSHEVVKQVGGVTNMIHTELPDF